MSNDQNHECPIPPFFNGAILGHGINDTQFSQENKLFEWSSGIESPHALLKEQGKGAFENIIELAQMPFGLVPEVLDPIDMTALGISQFMVAVDSFELVSLHRQGVVSTPRIRKNNTGWRNFSATDWHQIGSTTISNHLRVNLSTAFQNAENSNFFQRHLCP